MIDRAYVQRMARYNRWQNENLYGVADRLSDDERRRERGAWFGSIHKTLNHHPVGRPELDEPLHRPAAAGGRHSGLGHRLYPDWAEPEGRARGVRPDDHRLGRHASTMPGSPPT